MSERAASGKHVPDNPEEQPINEIQARFLAAESGLEAEELLGKPIGEVHERLRWVIDPSLLFFRKVCGRVVKKDPASGQYFGVPNATVHVEDTDCSFLGFFPVEGPFFWLWPTFCHREQIASAKTDRCGNFCVWVPRWDIDRVLRLRVKRVCLPEIVRPSIRDIIDHLRPEIVGPPRPGPIPDPPPFVFDREVLSAASRTLGTDVSSEIIIHADLRNVGDSSEQLDALLDAPAFPEPLPPPLPHEFAERLEQPDHPLKKALAVREVEKIDPQAFIGPFLRCRNVVTAEWETIVDVPDITFRVTQDVNADGSEEEIYSEGFFAVRWNAGSIPPVTLVASSIALASPFCEGPTDARECVDNPDLYAIGPMPLTSDYHDASAGYALRPNRPRPGGLYPDDPPVGPSQAPYFRELALFACHRLPNATHYRVMYDSGDGPQPFLVPAWDATTTPGQPTPTVKFVHDAEGWYLIQPPDTLEFPDWVLYWPSYYYPNGTYQVWVECRDGGGNPIGTPSDKVAFVLDNESTSLAYGTVHWWPKSNPGDVHTLPAVCPVIRRPSGETVVIEVPWSASAGYFRNANLTLYGCDQNAIAGTLSKPHYQHWYENFTDNSYGATGQFEISPTDSDGAYTLWLTGVIRSFHPTFDDGPFYNYNYDQVDGYAWHWIPYPIAVVSS